MSWKMIVLDEPTKKFLGALKAERQKAGLHQREVQDDTDLRHKAEIEAL